MLLQHHELEEDIMTEKNVEEQYLALNNCDFECSVKSLDIHCDCVYDKLNHGTNCSSIVTRKANQISKLLLGQSLLWFDHLIRIFFW